MDQALLGGASHQEMRQWAETDAQEAPAEHEEELLYCAGDHGLEQIVRGGCGASLTGGSQELLDALLCCVLWDDPLWSLPTVTHCGIL